MGIDRNTVIGFVLLGLLLFAYLYISTRNSHESQRQKQLFDDSVARVKAQQDALARARDTAGNKTVKVDTTGFNKAIAGTEKLFTIENDLISVTFSNKGGQPKSVQLKNFRSFDSSEVKVIDPRVPNRISYPIIIGPNQSAQTGDLYFDGGEVTKNADGSQTVVFRLPATDGESILHQFTLKPGEYALDWHIAINNPSRLFTNNDLNLNWHAEPLKTQENVVYERQQSVIGFSENNSFDYIFSRSEKKFERPVQWVSVAQQFFNSTLIAPNGFGSGELHWVRENADSSLLIGIADISLQTKIPAASQVDLPFRLYYGPNDYYILKKQAPGMDRIVNLGRDFYSFVRPINVFIIMPVFNFFKKFVGSYGLVILLLTLFIRLLTSPLVYSSYLSGAKMKALRPEIEEMRKRVGNDQQQMSMEQMKLFREAGVNPLGGCIPALLQIPIFFALYSFFNSNIALRGQSFLWSKDLSAYDSILNFGFNIPAYGAHVSLFALLAVITSFLISLYGMSMTPDQNNPAMKYMPYIMPVMLLLFFNRLPSALTWYYTVSNIITLILQWVIQTYIIDHDKILAKLQENRRKPKTKPKWQERLEQMQEAQKRAQQQVKGNRK